MKKDYYEILGVNKKSSKAEIKKAFRQKAQKYHPDKKDGDDKKFKEANEAYAVLSNDKKRKQYDAYGQAEPQMGGGAGFGGFDFSQFNQGGGGQSFNFDTEDIFGSFFNRGERAREKRGEDISISLDLTFNESVFGTEKTFYITKNSSCPDCDGLGVAARSKMKTCETCQGQGQTIKIKQTILGAIQMQATCETCRGQGQTPEKKCAACRGNGIVRKKEEINVHIPAGIETGQKLRVVGKGEAVSGGISGDLYIFISVANDRRFIKKYHDLYTKTEIPLTTAVLGGQVEVQGVDEKIKIKIKAGTPNDKKIKIRGQGVGEKGKHRGDLYTTIKVNIPTQLSSKQKKLFKELQSL